MEGGKKTISIGILILIVHAVFFGVSHFFD